MLLSILQCYNYDDSSNAKQIGEYFLLALLQRVKFATVVVAGITIGAVEHGLLVFVGIEKVDTNKHADRLIERLLGYRIFADPEGKMNLSVRDVAGGLLLVPQFTLAADTRKGMRPGFSTAADPKASSLLFDYLVISAKQAYENDKVASGEFGANMDIQLCNYGPATFILRV